MGLFSQRAHFEPTPNPWAKKVAQAHQSGQQLVDLTESNPTRCALHTPTSSEPLNTTPPTVYEPAPLGLSAAREAVAQYYVDLGMDITANQIVLTASTSESYSLLFKLLLNPNDAVLLPRPSYPLFDFLAQLDAV